MENFIQLLNKINDFVWGLPSLYYYSEQEYIIHFC